MAIREPAMALPSLENRRPPWTDPHSFHGFIYATHSGTTRHRCFPEQPRFFGRAWVRRRQTPCGAQPERWLAPRGRPKKIRPRNTHSDFSTRRRGTYSPLGSEKRQLETRRRVAAKPIVIPHPREDWDDTHGTNIHAPPTGSGGGVATPPIHPDHGILHSSPAGRGPKGAKRPSGPWFSDLSLQGRLA